MKTIIDAIKEYRGYLPVGDNDENCHVSYFTCDGLVLKKGDIVIQTPQNNNPCCAVICTINEFNEEVDRLSSNMGGCKVSYTEYKNYLAEALKS